VWYRAVGVRCARCPAILAPMRAQPLISTLLTAVPSALGACLCAVLLAAFLRKPSRPLLFFLCFYAVSVAHLAAGLLAPTVARWGGVRAFWEASIAVGRVRWLLLVLFAHSLHRLRPATVLAAVMTGLVAFAIASPFIIYSIIPSLVEMAVVLYVFTYLLALHQMRRRLTLEARGLELLRAVLACTGAFLIGLLLDLVEAIPQASPFISNLLFEFSPAYLVCVGAVVAVWAVRGLRPPAPRQDEGPFDLSGLRVSRREREVIRLILTGETNAGIADRLFISESTVKKHVNNLFRKLGISSRWELVKLTRRMHPEE
jgi:DNA-binding CsgD family transcriptional regulator